VNTTTLTWPIGFLLTLAVELPLYRAIARARTSDAALANLWTHPCVWFLAAPLSAHVPEGVALALLEVFAFGFEGAYLARHGAVRAYPASFIANAASVVLGVVLGATGIWAAVVHTVERVLSR
jgi:hypothetical protein